jgi:acyl CoA:acetate/3-ketoacid CoA transferase alpha subunit
MAKKILYQDNARRALERGMEIMVEGFRNIGLRVETWF